MKICCSSGLLRFLSISTTGVLSALGFQALAQINTTLPVITLTAPDATASEWGDKGSFRLFRSGPTNQALNVYWLVTGSATDGSDYASLPSTVAVPAGVREVVVPVSPLEDTEVEGPETVNARLAWPTPGSVSYNVGSPSNAVVAIFDNDSSSTNRPPTVRIVAPSNGTTFQAPANIQICADARDADGYVDYVEFFAGDLRIGARTNCLPCASIQNPFCIMWTNVPPGNYVLTAKATDSSGASSVSDPVGVSVRQDFGQQVVTVQAVDSSASEGQASTGSNTGTNVGVFRICRSPVGTNELLVYYSLGGSASNGVDYASLPRFATIPPNAPCVEVVVQPIDDNLAEGTERVELRIQPPVCIAIYPPPPDCYRVGSPESAVVYIADNEPQTNHPPEVRITRPLDGATLVAPVNVLIRADTVDSDGYVDHIEFYAGTTQIGEETRYFFTAPPPGEHQIYEMIWTNPPVGRHTLTARARDDDGAISVSPPVTVWVVETNRPPVTNFPPLVTITASDSLASEGTNCYRWSGWSNSVPPNYCGTNTATFVIRRSGPTNNPLAVFYRIGGTASNGVDYTELPGVMTIPAGRRAAEFKVVPIDDVFPECLETVVLGLRVPPDTTSNTPPYVIGYPNRAAAVIVDNDQPRPVTGLLPDRCFHIMKPGANGSWWRIECSTDMIHWSGICTNQVTDGALHFVDPDGDELPSRFYRAVPELSPPPPE